MYIECKCPFILEQKLRCALSHRLVASRVHREDDSGKQQCVGEVVDPLHLHSNTRLGTAPRSPVHRMTGPSAKSNRRPRLPRCAFSCSAECFPSVCCNPHLEISDQQVQCQEEHAGGGQRGPRGG